ncbi:MAG TPA: 50S ribosomal protein L25, partial [Candidatus Kaiserbacteria bacterium]|nr:50S ribosomal protein L25 [Candidatus Kaiserbacteria bacterium]
MNTLTAEKRDERGKRVHALRVAGRIPAVVYGPKQKSVPIVISLKEFEGVLKKAGESSVVSLAGLEKSFPV